jgi:hypothetical protein
MKTNWMHGCSKICKTKKQTPIKCYLENYIESHHMDEHDLLDTKNWSHGVSKKMKLIKDYI